jgi:negative regulator of sigma-B (phosphoserine phosphatase)
VALAVPRVEHGSRVRPCFGQARSGDATFYQDLGAGVFAAVIDALGHGPRAYDTAQRAVAFLRSAAAPEVTAVMGRLDAHLRDSVGAAAGLCFVDMATGAVRYAGVGNTVIRRFGSSDTRLVSRDGLLGNLRGKPREETMTLCGGDVLLLYTDGVRAHFAAMEYPDLLGHTTSTIAAQVVRRFGRQHDDAGCLALRYRA